MEAETWKAKFEVDANVREELEESKRQREELRKFLERTKEASAASKAVRLSLLQTCFCGQNKTDGYI